jgi:hypothetical protein
MGNAYGELFEEGKKRWYCECCDKRTPIEINPEWVADGRPVVWDSRVKDYAWLARCSCCECDYKYNRYDCPNCGYPHNVEKQPLKIENHHMNPYYAYEFGSTGYDWDEQHQCGRCRYKFWYSNSTH